MEHKNDITSHQMGRRKLLKALAAGGGAIAVTAIVPGKWAKPVIEAGLLPAHAQASPTAVPTAAYPTPFPCSQIIGLDIILAIDRSDSMVRNQNTGELVDKLDKAKQAAKGFVERINVPTDKVGIVSYSDYTTVDYPLGTDKNEAKSAIDAIVSYAATDIAGATRKSGELLANSLPSRGPVLVLLTDGVQTIPGGNPVAEANTAKLNGVYIITIGLGNDVDETILRRMASSEGDYYFAPTSNQLDSIYQSISSKLCNPNTRRRWQENKEDDSSNRGSSSEEDDPIGAGPSR
jgi:Mg-chelatase subunit ChlD